MQYLIRFSVFFIRKVKFNLKEWDQEMGIICLWIPVYQRNKDFFQKKTQASVVAQ